jgi:hypothetical protein
LFRRNDEGRIYGATFIDHTTRTILNGSRLSKEYSANVFNDLFGGKQEQVQESVQERAYLIFIKILNSPVLPMRIAILQIMDWGVFFQFFLQSQRTILKMKCRCHAVRKRKNAGMGADVDKLRYIYQIQNIST